MNRPFPSINIGGNKSRTITRMATQMITGKVLVSHVAIGRDSKPEDGTILVDEPVGATA